MINALAAHEAVTIGTISSSASDDSLPGGLYGDHAYGVIGYTASTGLFTLYNPWGMDQPQQLSWSQLESTTDGFVVADPSGSTPIAGGSLHSPASAAWQNGSAAAAGGANTSNNSNSALSPAAVDAYFGQSASAPRQGERCHQSGWAQPSGATDGTGRLVRAASMRCTARTTNNAR